MGKVLRWAMVVAVLTMIAPSVASAENFYVAVRGGPGWTPDTTSGIAGGEDIQKFNLGFTGSGAIGYMTPFGLRFDGEFGFLYSPLKSDGGVNVSGSLKSYTAFANVYYDLKLSMLGPFKPYVGVGIGAARVNADRQVFADSLGVKFDADEWRNAFAYQGRVGIGYELSTLFDLSLGYRYVHINGGEVRDIPKVNTSGMDNHSVEFGVAIKF